MSSFAPPAPSDLTDPRDRRYWNNIVRRIKLSLLRALPKNRLTEMVRRHVEQEERVFPDSELDIRMSSAQWIGPIMDSSMIARASDEDVVNAFRTLPDASGWNHPRDWMVGGNVQLSREFANFAKEKPGRAIRLIGLLDAESGTRAAACALEAMSESADPEKVLQLFGDVVHRGFDSEDFRGFVSRAMVKLVDRGVAIGEDVVSILEGWLADPYPAERNNDFVEWETDIDTGAEAASAEWKNEEDGIHRSLLWGLGGFSSVPGGDYPILEALIRIRLVREEFDKIDEMLRVYLDRSKDPELWDNLLRYVPFLHPKDGLRRAALLERLFEEVPGLIETREAAHVVARAQWWNAEFVDAQLDRWADSKSRITRQAYGEIVAAVALLQPTLKWAQGRLDDLVVDGASLNARTGAALTAANLWSDASHREGAGALLKTSAGYWRSGRVEGHLRAVSSCGRVNAGWAYSCAVNCDCRRDRNCAALGSQLRGGTIGNAPASRGRTRRSSGRRSYRGLAERTWRHPEADCCRCCTTRGPCRHSSSPGSRDSGNRDGPVREPDRNRCVGGAQDDGRDRQQVPG